MMEADFWQQRWRDNQIGFHQATPTPLLLKHWPALGVPEGSRVFVPLAGKSHDMAWLASQGYRVLGVELSTLAVEQFFAEHALVPRVSQDDDGRCYSAGGIDVVCGDAFTVADARLQACSAVFDRAAVIALPASLRQRYARELYPRLPRGCRGLMITLEYPQDEREGPPFSVPEDEVHALFDGNWTVERMDRRPIAPDHPGFIGGVSRLDTAVYRIDRR